MRRFAGGRSGSLCDQRQKTRKEDIELVACGYRLVSELVRGKYDKFSLDILVTLATRAVGRVELAVC